MVILRDDARIAQMKKWSRRLSLIGFLILAVGFVLVFTEIPNYIYYQFAALIVGWILWQIGMYLANRYARSPRPDEVLDEAFKGIARNGRMYHYLLPVPHVLLLPAGPIVLVPKFQTGEISVDGDTWRQKGVGLRKFFGQEGLGNPTREAEKMIKALASYISKHAPQIEELDIGAIIVFTAKGLSTLDIERSTIPARHYSKVKGYLREKGLGKPLPPEEYGALQSAFDEAAGHLIEE